MKKILTPCLILLLWIGISAPLAQAESLNMTTYYPAPFGAYDHVQLVPRPTPPTCSPGTLYTDTNGDLFVCTDVGGTINWINAGPWRQVGNNLYPRDFAVNPNLNIGIGTNTPYTKLTIVGNTPDIVPLDARITIENQNANSKKAELVFYRPDLTSGGWVLGTDKHATNSHEFYIWGGDILPTDQPPFVILGNGNVGIGSTDPSAKLLVQGKFITSGNGSVKLEVEPDTGAPTSNDKIYLQAFQDQLGIFGPNGRDSVGNSITHTIRMLADTYSFHAKAGVGGAPGPLLMSILSTGNVGIGVNNPTRSLHINNNQNSTEGHMLLLEGVGDETAIEFQNALNPLPWEITQENGHLGIHHRPATVDSDFFFIIQDDGNIGMGTRTPTQLLDVNGQIRIRGGNPGAGKVLVSDASGNATWAYPTYAP